jgi:hypothetical protein
MQGTSLVLTAAPGKNTAFTGWSGGCSGSGKCSVAIGGTVSIGATFHSGLSDAQSEALADAGHVDAVLAITAITEPVASSSPSSSPSVSSPPTPSPSTHLLISQIQIAGATSANDFVKIYNPAPAAVDIGGWKLRKKSSTGSDASLREFPKGLSVGAGAYFIWANSANGFAQSISADASSSQTLSADNSVALFDADGVLIDSVAWGNGANQYGEGSPYPTNPAASQILERSVDTDNNAKDFDLH